MSTKKLQILDSLIKEAQNADTLDGKHAEEFATTSDVEELKTKVGDTAVSEQISTAIGGVTTKINNNTSNIIELGTKALTISELPYLIEEGHHGFTSVVYGNEKYVAIDALTQYFYISSNGIDWEKNAITPIAGNYEIGAYGNGKYVFVSMNNPLGYPIALYSEDATTWNYHAIEYTMDGFSDVVWNKMVFENGKFILSGEDVPFVISSIDAINWTCSNVFLYNNHVVVSPHSICYGNGKYVAFGQSNIDLSLPYLTSTDAITWSVDVVDLSSLDIEILLNINPQSRFLFSNNIVYANNKFVAVFDKAIAISTDGVDWNFTASLPFRSIWTSNIVYKNNVFIVISCVNDLNRPVAYSTNGINWSIVEDFDNIDKPWAHVVNGSDKLLLATPVGELAWSFDGINWTYAIKSVATLTMEDKTSDLKEVLNVGDPIYVAEEGVDAPAEVINADTLGGYSSSDFRHSDWMPTAEEVGAAPAGYGLGEGNVNDLTTLVELDAVKVNSFRNYYGEALPVERASSSNHSQGGVLTIHGHKFVTQYFFLRYPNRGCVLKRYTDTDGEIWGEWEWVNPPMAPGVEYRTTERYNGKPVYVKLIDFGALPNASGKDVAFYDDTTSRPISVAAQVGKVLDSLYFTIPANYSGTEIWISAVNYNTIRLTTVQDNSDLQARVLVKYWKSTD